MRDTNYIRNKEREKEYIECKKWFLHFCKKIKEVLLAKITDEEVVDDTYKIKYLGHDILIKFHFYTRPEDIPSADITFYAIEPKKKKYFLILCIYQS